MNVIEQAAEWAVKLWNSQVAIGTPVRLIDDLGRWEHTRTRSKAWLVCGHPCVLVEGRTGGYLLYRIQPEVTRG